MAANPLLPHHSPSGYHAPMHWLLHGNPDPAIAAALARRGHQAHTLAELSLPPDADLLAILQAAEQRQWELLTNDKALASAPFDRRYPFPRTIVFLQLEGGDVEQDDAIDRLFDRYKRLSPRRLYTLTASRVKVRQLPTGSP